MRSIIIACLALGAHALQQQSLSADPAFQLEEESSQEVIDGENRNMFDIDGDVELKGSSEEYGMAAEELMARMSVFPDLGPTDFKEKSSRAMWGTISHKTMYFGAMIAFGAAVAAIYSNRGMFTCMCIATYTVSLVLMSVSIRNCFVSHSFNYPQWLVVMHQLATIIVGAIILKVRENQGGKKIEYPTATTLFKGLIPVAMTFALSLGLSNLGLLYANTHFYEMMGTFQVFAVVGLACMLGRPFNGRYALPLCVCTLGLIAVAFGEIRFNLLGAIFVVGGVITRAAKVQLQSMLLAPNQMTQHFDAVELTFWTACITSAIMLAWSTASEGMGPWNDIQDFGTIVAVAATCGAAIILNFCSMFVMKEVGPVAQQLIGQTKGVLACIGGWAAFNEIITLQQIIGYSVVVAGVAWYNHIDLQIKAEVHADMQKVLNSERQEA